MTSDEGYDLTSVDPGVQPLTPGETADASGQKRRASNAVTCGRCGAWWTGLAVAHCGGCHRTFASVSLFDRHRDQHGDRGRCVHPSEIKKGPVMEFRDGAWRGPEMSEEAKAKFRK